MALSFLNSGAATAIDGGNPSVDVSGWGLAQNDILVAFVAAPGNSGTVPSISGYTSLFTSSSGVSATPKCVAAYKIMGATPDTSVVGTGTGDAADSINIVVFGFRGEDPATQPDATATSATGSASAPNNPAITTVTANAGVVAFAASAVSDASVTAPSGYGGLANVNGTDTRNMSTAGAWNSIASPGAEDPAAWTLWSNGQWIAITCAIRPETSSATTVMHPWRTSLGTRVGSRQLARSD